MTLAFREKALVPPPLWVRSKMFVPAHREDFIGKCTEQPWDMVVFDLEDGVPGGLKPKARALAREALEDLDFGGRRTGVRVNALSSGELWDDLEAIVCDSVWDIHLSKANGTVDIRETAAMLTELERRRAIRRPIGIVPTLEHPGAIQDAYHIAMASPRVTMLQFGAADLKATVGMRLDSLRLAYPRSQITFASARAGIPALDTAYLAYRDIDGFRSEALDARDFGFRGKSCIHPSQIEIANEVFSPTDDEIGWAESVLAAAGIRGDRPEASDPESVAIAHEGRFIDKPVISHARSVIAMARHLKERQI